VDRVVFTPGAGARVVASVRVGPRRGAVDGPHGLAVTPDGRDWFVSLAHAWPEGHVSRYSAADSLVGVVPAGSFPGPLAVGGRFLYVTNGNPHDPGHPAGITILYIPTLTEVGRVPTCVGPRGGRIGAAGRHYSVCQAAEQLVVVDTRRRRVSGRFLLVPGQESTLPLDFTGDDPAYRDRWPARCGPVWVEPARGRRLYVSCAASRELVEVDGAGWQVAGRVPMEAAPGQLAALPDARVLVALPDAQAVVVVGAGGVVARIRTSRERPHGVAVSDDGRFAFVSNEALPGTRGTVDVIDLVSLQAVATVEVGHQPGPIAFVGANR
jgi:DNA-binding beta-propeller fold protein YncE